jgi:hypothetical protein
MTPFDDPLVAVNAYVTAAFGLVGSLIGGAIAGIVSLVVARQARETAERSWIRDNRREIYDRFLARAQRLLIACEACKDDPSEETRAAVDQVHADFFEANAILQTVAERTLVEASRVQAYRLVELRRALDSRNVQRSRLTRSPASRARRAT